MKLADEIAFSIVRDFQKSGYEIIIPNFFYGAYEMDVFRRMKSGYIYEYEIKISRADFFNDFKKSISINRGDYMNPNYEEVFKHNEIKQGKGKANRFFFVIKKGIVSVDEVPEYAGLIEYENGYFKTIKNAPLIHKRKADDKKFFEELAVSLSFRELNKRLKIYRLRHQVKTLKALQKENFERTKI